MGNSRHRDNLQADVSAFISPAESTAVDIVSGASHVIVGTSAAVVQAGYGVDARASIKLVVDAPVGFALAWLEQSAFLGLQVIVTTVNCCPEYVEDLWDGEPRALLAGQSLTRQLADAMESIARGERYRLAPGAPTVLTPSERLALRYVARGWSNADIARRLGLKERTIMNTLTSVYGKLAVDSRAAAILYYWGVWRMAQPSDWRSDP
jgi:DNA-binding CsgD family transcriptional regulator